MTSLKDNRILRKMLDRLFAALVNGPSLNAKPHSSRQRIDMTQLAKLGDRPLDEVLRQLLGADRSATLTCRIPAPRRKVLNAHDEGETESLSPEEKAALKAYADQQSVINKCRAIAEDAKAYENDTGVRVLQIGFPLLSLPPGSVGAGGLTRRITAPICFISLAMTVKAGPTPAIAMECRNEGADLIVPNVALLAWLQSQAGQEIGELPADETGEKPWDEISQIVARVAKMLSLDVPPIFATGQAMQTTLKLEPCPRADDEDARPRIIASAIVGLFPAANEGLIRDTQSLLAGEEVAGPIENFLDPKALMTEPPQAAEAPDAPAAAVTKARRAFADERFITLADPFQSRAVKLARKARGLVMHGPPGTGKSQTIANIIGDHLARGQRVLFVCDKRTALDVVMNRLDAMELGGLCAIVHDPQRDQRELYRSIRDQLDTLAELRTKPSAEKQLEKIDTELQALHDELTQQHQALMQRPDANSASFHEMMGQWLSIPASDVRFDEASLNGVTPALLEAQTHPLTELLDRGAAVDYANNPWALAAGMPLATFLAMPMDQVRQKMNDACAAAANIDATAHPTIPPFAPEADLTKAAEDRSHLAAQLKNLPPFEPARLQQWAQTDLRVIQQHVSRLVELAKPIELIAKGALDAELGSALRAAPPTMAAINQQIVAMDQYLVSSASFLGFLAFGIKKSAAAVLAAYGLQLGRDNATRVRDFLQALKARYLVHETVAPWTGAAPGGALPADDELLRILRQHQQLFEIIGGIENSSDLKPLREKITAALIDPEARAALIDGLERSTPRAQGILAAQQRLRSGGLFSEPFHVEIARHLRGGGMLGERVTALQERLGTLENVLRTRDGLTKLPDPLRPATAQLLTKNLGAQTGLGVLSKAVLAQEITRRLRSDPRLQQADTQRLQSSFDRYIQLENQKRTATRDAILHLWGTKQKERLVAATGSRLNSEGADARRRFMLRGERAMRLRQVIAVGQSLPGGDPLFDLRPVWMASPETVAQIFPRRELFDVIVFDEASQCRLEEALPVLLRAGRVVIAGDPKQLPPTRFFESAVAASEDDDIETDQQLFESQQSEIEDLLGAALNIEIEECYLNVHYRSHNSDLIEFSNEYFYGSRLQPIPGHPSQRSKIAPLTLYAMNGQYIDRQNPAEAQKVAEITRELLLRDDPPSIGIASFNITQRDLILEKLDDLAAEDAKFAKALEKAWTRQGKGSFEGLFVKNLENVQGDERDHMIISTTYGPDAAGRFYRRFGPLGRAGGGRRLNVLVTRARDQVHIVTSIPDSEYRRLPPVPPGQQPGGPWLLFSYLAFAESLGEAYAHRAAEQQTDGHAPELKIHPTRYPSEFCKSLGQDLVAQHRTGSDVFWGNDGFCVDLAIQDPQHGGEVTIGVMCDTTRFEAAADPVEWEIFRTGILQSQNWQLHRVWTPHFFRDRQGTVESIIHDAAAYDAQHP
jgi:hypothetical protein